MSRIDRYWRNRFGLVDEFERPGVHVVPHAKYSGDDLVLVFVKGDVSVLSVSRPRVESVRDRVAHAASSAMLDPGQIAGLIDRRISHCVGPLYEGYAEADTFRPAPLISEVVTLDHSYVKYVKRLVEDSENSGTDVTPVGRDIIREFVSASDPIDLEQSGLARADSSLFAVVDDSGIRAMAHYSMWATDAASIGVLTHPAHRRRGLGKAAVSAAMSDAFTRSYFVLYRTLLANGPSVALAESLGCLDYGRFLAVHLKEAA